MQHRDTGEMGHTGHRVTSLAPAVNIVNTGDLAGAGTPPRHLAPIATTRCRDSGDAFSNKEVQCSAPRLLLSPT